KIPSGNYFFNFEKVSKRTYLDIASVNSAILISLDNGFITEVNISAGGVSATPLFLYKTSEFLKGKELTIDNIKEAVFISSSEIAPITDARGSAEYKSLLLSRLIYTHFITLFPEILCIEQTV
ncbi:MAG: (2Fe-2S)-binding protein, partial [Bacteroidota bacterium]